jgi:hypothetical protein
VDFGIQESINNVENEISKLTLNKIKVEI